MTGFLISNIFKSDKYWQSTWTAIKTPKINIPFKFILRAIVWIIKYCDHVHVNLCTRTTDTQRQLFFQNSQTCSGLGRQIGLTRFVAFWVLSAKLQHPSWHCEPLAHGFEHVFFLNKLWFSGLNIQIPINPKYVLARIWKIAITRPSSVLRHKENSSKVQILWDLKESTAFFENTLQRLLFWSTQNGRNKIIKHYKTDTMS